MIDIPKPEKTPKKNRPNPTFLGVWPWQLYGGFHGLPLPTPTSVASSTARWQWPPCVQASLGACACAV